MTLSIIAAVAANGAIGRNGDLAYHISADLRRFKEITMGHPIIMGRRTFESFPKGALPGRRNIVVSRTPGYTAPGAEVFTSLDEALKAVEAVDEAFIIGGAQIYTQSIHLADKLYITFIEASPDDADAFFPAIDQFEWAIGESSDRQYDEKSGVYYSFMTLTSRR